MTRIGAASLVALAATLTVPTVLQANVFEVGDDGSVRTRAATGHVEWRGDRSSEASDDGDVVESAPEVPADAVSPAAALGVPPAYEQMLLAAARRYDVSPSLLAALVWRESAWKTTALSNKGAIGLGQLMPATARTLAVDPRDSASNLDGAAHYLRNMLDLFDGDVERALAAYNAGPRRVLKANGIPPIPETRTYVSTIISRLAVAQPATSTGDIR